MVSPRSRACRRRTTRDAVDLSTCHRMGTTAPLALSRATERDATRRTRECALKGFDRLFERARRVSAPWARVSMCRPKCSRQRRGNGTLRRPSACFDERAERSRRARRARRSLRRRRSRDEACARRRARARGWDRRWNPWRRPRARCVDRVDRARTRETRRRRDGGFIVRCRA